MTRSRLVVVLLALVTAGLPARADEPAALARARALYNTGDYDEAIAQARVARREAAWADAATLVLSRAHLERYRQEGNFQDLVDGREALAEIRAAALSPRDHVDLIVGLGQALYLEESFGAAAELFDTALGNASLLETRDRLLLLDWWATSLDREAQRRPFDRRGPLFERISERMEEELRRDPGSAVPNYWLVVSARGAGDLDAAWNTAIAAWVRATLDPMTAEELRIDLDRLMTQAIIPERSRLMGLQHPQEALATLAEEWERVKREWK